MKLSIDRKDTLALALVAAAAVATALVFPRLPSPMPTHFDAHGAANGWMPRALGAWLPLGIAVALWALGRGLPALVPASWRDRAAASRLPEIMLVTVVLLLAVHFLVLRAALTSPARLSGAVLPLLGVFFVALAQYLPRTRRNPVVGIRTAWTLSSDENWARTHRVAGYSMTAGGLATLALGLVDRPALAIAAVLASVIAPAAYSWWLARTLPPEG